jgi:uncharacterized protein (DUF58 family)
VSEAAASTQLLFDSAFLRKLERVELVARKHFRGQLRGEHATRRRGQGQEFSDHRRYRPGDDVRHVDWNIYSRLERLFLKLYAAEEDMSLHLLLDCSASMGFGAPSKFDQARRIAACLGYVGLSNLDRVAVTAFSDEVGAALAPMKGRRRLNNLLQCLQALRCGGATALERCAREHAARRRAPGVAVLLSDLMVPEQVGAGIDALRGAGHQVLVIQLLAEEEIDPPLDGALRLHDSESGEALAVTVDAGLRAAYRRALARRLETLEHHCLVRGVEYLRASTAIAFEDVVLRYLRQGGLLR